MDFNDKIRYAFENIEATAERCYLKHNSDLIAEDLGIVRLKIAIIERAARDLYSGKLRLREGAVIYFQSEQFVLDCRFIKIAENTILKIIFNLDDVAPPPEDDIEHE